MKLKTIAQGAEAKIFLDKKNNLVIKDRISKSYRHPKLDKRIIKQRTKSETKLLTKASFIINAPVPLTTAKSISSEERASKFSLKGRAGGETFENKILMPFIDGKKLSEHLDSFPLKQQKQIMKQIGNSIAKLHKADIIHGDLTTSNMILMDNSEKEGNLLKENKLVNINKKLSTSGARSYCLGWVGGINLNPKNKKFKIYFIDFGLGYISRKTEDKAVDLHLLKQALEAKHFKNWETLLKEVFKEYKKNYPGPKGVSSGEAEKIFERIKAIEKRGRYRH